MIVIDKSKLIQHIILKITELTTIQNVKYLMVLINDATRTVYKIVLPENISLSPVRYDLFNTATSNFKELEAGYYSFYIYEQDQNLISEDEVASGKAITVGKLLVKAICTQADDDYIIYKN